MSDYSDALALGHVTYPGQCSPCPHRSKPLTISEAAAIGDILRMAEQCSKVARLDDTVPMGVTYGTARMVGTDTGCASPQGADVRDMYLRVTTQQGWEQFWPIRDLIPQVIINTFVTYDW